VKNFGLSAMEWQLVAGDGLVERDPSPHPDYAALVDPLFRCAGKRVKN